MIYRSVSVISDGYALTTENMDIAYGYMGCRPQNTCLKRYGLRRNPDPYIGDVRLRRIAEQHATGRRRVFGRIDFEFCDGRGNRLEQRKMISGGIAQRHTQGPV